MSVNAIAIKLFSATPTHPCIQPSLKLNRSYYAIQIQSVRKLCYAIPLSKKGFIAPRAIPRSLELQAVKSVMTYFCPVLLCREARVTELVAILIAIVLLVCVRTCPLIPQCSHFFAKLSLVCHPFILILLMCCINSWCAI